MNLEEQIYYSCAAYSSIHPNRAAVLNHLFVVLGNGYEWENGELVECCGDTTTKSGKRLSMKAAINQVFRNRRKSDEFRKEWERKRKIEEKQGLKHAKACPKKNCTCGAQARIDAAKAQNKSINDLIEKCLQEMKNRPPQSAEEKAAEKERHNAEMKKVKADIRNSRKHDYRVPADIKKRVKDTAFD